MLPDKTSVLIIGAGPTGLATALSLLHEGIRDFVIVDSDARTAIGSRALAIHAATLEALESIGVAAPLIARGIQSESLQITDRSQTLIRLQLTPALAPYTKFPFVLTLPQSITENVLEEQLNKNDVTVARPYKLLSVKPAPGGQIEATFETGEKILSQVVIGADGAKSATRQSCNVPFLDPDGEKLDAETNVMAQMVFADVTFSSPIEELPNKGVFATAFGGTFVFIAPIPIDPDAHEPGEHVYRLGFNVTLSSGSPPPTPSMEYLQEHLDKQGPTFLSSDPSVNPNPVRIKKSFWSTRFRTHSAIAERFMVRLDGESPGDGGVVLLIGDAAHIHSPAGGQGMNLGIRDAIGVGSALSKYLKDDSEDRVKALEDFVTTRRERALHTIRLTKRLLSLIGSIGSGGFFGLQNLIFKMVGGVSYVQNMMAWRLSGLGNR